MCVAVAFVAPERRTGCELSGWQGPYRLVVRTSRCGRDNPGSTPGEDIFVMRGLCCGVERVQWGIF